MEREIQIRRKKTLIFLNKVKTNLVPVCSKIKEDFLSIYPNTKQLAQLSNQITYKIASICSSSDIRYNYVDAVELYSYRENAKMIYDKILDIFTMINCEYGIDFEINKKLVCMLMGINLSTYQEFISNSTLESHQIFEDIEEFLISVKSTSSEVGTRNTKAIQNSLSMDSKYGGHSIDFGKSSIANSYAKTIATDSKKAKEAIEAKYNDL